MKLEFLGAAHEVTGSCILLNAAGKNIVIDCGMEQGRDIYENDELPVSAGLIDAILLTHAHIDHSGRIPLLVKQGFSGPIYSTDATADLCEIMLMDSAHIQEFEAEWKNRKGKRAGKALIEPMYTSEDVMRTMKQFNPTPYGKEIEIFDGIKIAFTDVGHLLGSASITVTATENGKTERFVFSGDIGNLNQPILKDPNYLKQADYIITESTYGDRLHGERPDYISSLASIIQDTFDRGGNLVIPCFAVGRTQEILYFIREIKEKNLVKGHGTWPVYVDSPLAVQATKIVSENYAECFDDEAMKLISSGINPLQFDGLKLAITSDESKLINFDNQSKVIISASGMCEAGRIRHHLKHNLWREDSTILFVGYQAAGTLGRLLVDGVDTVKLFGETIEVKSVVLTLAGVSGHADRNGLLKWASEFEPKPKKAFVVHGEDAVTDIYADRLKSELGIDADAPYSGAIYDISQGCWLDIGNRKRIEKGITPQTARKNSVYQRLLNAGKRLAAIITRSEGRTNKDLSKFADQIDSLCDKWEN